MPVIFALRHLAIVAFGGLLSACSGIPIDAGGTRHYLIIGFGVVSVPRSQPDQSVSVHKMQAVGLSLSDQPGLKLSIGYASGLVTVIPDHLDGAVVEVSQRPFGPIRVSTEPHEPSPFEQRGAER